MKKLLIMATAIGMLASCNSGSDKTDTTDKQSVAAPEGDIYTVDSTSAITWSASKPTATHTGTFNISEGKLYVKDNALTGGSFVINMASLNNVDLSNDPENKGKLEGHLKSPDFFDIAKYPTSTFQITSVLPYSDSVNKEATHLVKGNLTLKDSTKNVSFPARITVDAVTLSAAASFTIDRTEWGMNYKGPGNPQDWFITKNVNIKISVAATKK
ncbi:MAG TPA: YceI family protein [Ferruginibacter sp.]|nr:YceI family protein [Ferruginibacter sp.]